MLNLFLGKCRGELVNFGYFVVISSESGSVVRRNLLKTFQSASRTSVQMLRLKLTSPVFTLCFEHVNYIEIHKDAKSPKINQKDKISPPQPV